MKKRILAISLFLMMALTACTTQQSELSSPETPEEAITLLKEQNEKYINALVNDGDISLALRENTVENGQTPYAVVLTCADSRVTPEHIFMEGLNRLFTIRNAGNIADETVIGSVEYGVAHLDTKVVLVLGHTECGAVHATITDGGHDYITYITDEIKDAIKEETDARTAEILNVEHSIANLLESEIISEAAHNGEIALVGAIYDSCTGSVDFID